MTIDYAKRGALGLLLAFAFISCQRMQPILVEPAGRAASPEVPSWPGVDSTVAGIADTLAATALTGILARERHLREARTARALALLADSLLGTQYFGSDPPSADSIAAQVAFNEGAQALNAYAQESDSVRAAALLREAAARFEAALKEDPFDEDAHYWLARVYELQSDAFADAGAFRAAIVVLQRLVSLQGHRQRYIALLAEAHERLGTRASGLAAGALWQRAAQVTMDDAEMDPEQAVLVDSALVFMHLARSSRAFVQAHRSDLALAALAQAAHWSTQAADTLYIVSEREWLQWDEGNLETREHFDSLLALGVNDAAGAASGMEALLPRVTGKVAHLEVQHELALLWYRSERTEDAVRRLQKLFAAAQRHTAPETARHARIREDYGAMAYNIGLAHRAAGAPHAALSYLLQSEATGFSQAPRAALEVSRLVANNVSAAIDAGLRAEQGMAQLPPAERRALLRHLVELFRRSGDRGRAREYVEKYRRLE